MQVNKNEEYINELIKKASNIAIVCSPKGIDSVASGIALSQYIEEEFSHPSSVIYNGSVETFPDELIQIHKIDSSFKDQVLKMTLDYNETTIESVNYYTKEDESKLVLEVRPIERNFDLGRIKYDFVGTNYDLIITIGVDRLESLADLYYKNEADFKKADIINFDNSHNNSNFGKINIVDVSAESLSAMLFKKFSDWNYMPSKEASKSLLIGLSN